MVDTQTFEMDERQPWVGPASRDRSRVKHSCHRLDSGQTIPLLRDESAQLRIGGPICPSERRSDRAAISPRRIATEGRLPLFAHTDSPVQVPTGVPGFEACRLNTPPYRLGVAHIVARYRVGSASRLVGSR